MNVPINANHVHLVGVGGIGMSALARWLLARGYRVSGCDRDPGEQGEALRLLGAHIQVGHDGAHLDGVDLVVISSAVRADIPDVAAAREAGVTIIKRAELLAQIANTGRGIAVAGTHGKTTTSALIGHLLTDAGLDPTVLIGGVSANLGSNARIGESDLVVVEADEYDASFLRLRPEIGVITNAEADHLDFYGTVEHVHEAFRAYARSITGTLIACADDPIMPSLVTGVAAAVQTYGIDQGEFRATDIQETGALTTFTAGTGNDSHRYRMSLAGRHNVRNALAAILVGRRIGMPENAIARGLESFRGVTRRFERKGEAGGVLVLDDYAHHPTEIRTNLDALQARFKRPIRLVFQPHTYSRTKSFLAEFAASFAGADAVYLLDIYAARETDTLGITGQDLADLATAQHPHVVYAGTADTAIERVLADARLGDLVVTMGAGDVYRLGPRLLERLAKQ
jgi:UDP-N-acetylmuramate--alanine ligase